MDSIFPSDRASNEPGVSHSTQAHEALWSAARKALGEPGGTRALIEVLLLHRHMNDQDVIAGIRAALSVGSFCVDVVAVEARKAREIREPA